MNIIKLKVEKKPILCHGCLSSDRRLTLIQDDSALFYSLLGDQHQVTFDDTKDLTLCWECIAIMKKIQSFQNRIQNAQFILLQSLCHLDPPSTLSTLSLTYKCNYDVTVDEDDNTETENKIKLNDLTDEIKQEDIAEDNELFDIITKEENDYSDTEYVPEITEENGETERNRRRGEEEIKKKIKKSRNNEESKIGTQSIKMYLKYATVSEGERIDYSNFSRYYSKVNASHVEMEELTSRERKHRSFDRLPFKCQVCRVAYSRRVDFNRHNACNHNESPPYRCTQCKSTRESFNDLVEHWRIHTPMLKCNKCGNLSRSRGELRKHMNRAHASIFTCNSCGGKFGNLREFRDHYKNQHERVICDYCNKTFSKKISLEIHIKRQHLPAICPICKQKYTRYRALVLHYRMYHTELTCEGDAGDSGREAAYCVECDKQFANVYLFKKHLAQAVIHTPPKRVRVPCPDCGKLFSRKTYMNNHYRLMHSKETKFYCEICNKFFARGYGLRVHRKYVHDKLPKPRTKICDICGRGFESKRILDNHRRTHTGERPFKCEHCPASFAQQTAMKTHQKTQHKNVLT